MSRKIGLQLWSIKQDLEKDFKAGLKQVAQLGYDGVEFAGYYGIEAPKMKELLQEYGLEVAGVHHNVDELDQNLEAIMAYNRVLENRDIVCSWAPAESYEQVQESIRKLQKAAAVLRENGFRLHYHNHSHEFVQYDGEYAIDIMAKAVEGMKAEVDTYWVWNAGVDVCAYLEKRREDITLVHIKDGTKEVRTAVGEGIVDIQSILDKSAEIGAQWLIVEDESEPGGLDSVARGIRNLKEKFTVR